MALRCRLSGDPLGHHNKAAVIEGVLTGGKGQQFVAVLRGKTGVVEGQTLDFGNEFVEFLFIVSLVEHVVGEALAHIGAGTEAGNNLVCMMLIQGVEGQILMLLPEGLALVPGLQLGKHGAVCHMVSVQHHIIRRSVDITDFTGIDGTPFAPVVVEVPLQVVVLVAGGLHNGIIDLGAGHFDPAYHIVILLVERQILRKDLGFGRRGSGGRDGGFRGSGDRRSLSGRCLGGGRDGGGNILQALSQTGKIIITLTGAEGFDCISGDQHQADSKHEGKKAQQAAVQPLRKPDTGLFLFRSGFIFVNGSFLHGRFPF